MACAPPPCRRNCIRWLHFPHDLCVCVCVCCGTTTCRAGSTRPDLLLLVLPPVHSRRSLMPALSLPFGIHPAFHELRERALCCVSVPSTACMQLSASMAQQQPMRPCGGGRNASSLPCFQRSRDRFFDLKFSPLTCGAVYVACFMRLGRRKTQHTHTHSGVAFLPCRLAGGVQGAGDGERAVAAENGRWRLTADY